MRGIAGCQCGRPCVECACGLGGTGFADNNIAQLSNVVIKCASTGTGTVTGKLDLKGGRSVDDDVVVVVNSCDSGCGTRNAGAQCGCDYSGNDAVVGDVGMNTPSGR
eukprot:350211-Chlamydomonas_euryale.AAC.4